MSKILFIANGQKLKLSKKFFNDFDEIVCVDGGYNSIKLYNVLPTFLIGDLDSANVDDKKLPENCKVIFKDNQDESDLEFAVKYIIKNIRNIKEITIINALGLRLDHTINNIIFLNSIPNKIKTKIIGENEELYLVRNNIILNNVLNKTLSILPITNIKGLTTSGLKWELNNFNTKFGFVGGISNICLKDNINISLKSGKVLVIINKK